VVAITVGMMVALLKGDQKRRRPQVEDVLKRTSLEFDKNVVSRGIELKLLPLKTGGKRRPEERVYQ